MTILIFDDLWSRGHQRSKWSFFGKNVFANNFLSKKAREMNLSPLNFSRQARSNGIHDDLERSISNYDLRSRPDQVMTWPKLVMWHIIRSALTRRTLWCLSHVSIFIQSVVITKNPQVTPGWPQMTLQRSLIQSCILVLTCDLRQHDPARFEEIACVLTKREAFQYFPIALQWRGDKIDLTLGHRGQNSEIYTLYLSSSSWTSVSLKSTG